MRLLATLFGWVRNVAGRRRARALLAQGLPRGLSAPLLRPALRAPAVAAPNEYATLLLGAQVVRGDAPRRLLRLAALPRALPGFSVVRPDRFRLDADLRLPPERDAARTAGDLPSPVPPRHRPPPRTPLARAPISRVDPRAFRIDARDLKLANEEGIPLEPASVEHVWLHPALRRALIAPRWMASRRPLGVAPFAAEWFASWWAEHKAARHGAGQPKVRRPPAALADWLEQVKEQMLIRRDVAKDEAPPAPARYKPNQVARPIAAHPGLLRDQFCEWRTLLDALADG